MDSALRKDILFGAQRRVFFAVIAALLMWDIAFSAQMKTPEPVFQQLRCFIY